VKSAYAFLRQLVIPFGAPASAPQIVIGGDLPPPLDTYLFLGTTKADAAILFLEGGASNTFNFIAHVATAGNSYIWIGAVRNGAVVEATTGRPAGESFRITDSGSAGALRLHLTSSGIEEFDYTIDDMLGNVVSQPRGTIFHAADGASDSAAVAVETVIDTYTNVRLPGHRAFKVEVGGFLQNSVAGGQVQYRLRNTSVVGHIFFFRRTSDVGTPAQVPFVDFHDIFTNAGNEGTFTFVKTIEPIGGGNAQERRTAVAQRYIRFFDIGDSADWGSYPNIT
jgi:hypothetical protein